MGLLGRLGSDCPTLLNSMLAPCPSMCDDDDRISCLVGLMIVKELSDATGRLVLRRRLAGPVVARAVVFMRSIAMPCRPHGSPPGHARPGQALVRAFDSRRPTAATDGRGQGKKPLRHYHLGRVCFNVSQVHSMGLGKRSAPSFFALGGGVNLARPSLSGYEVRDRSKRTAERNTSTGMPRLMGTSNVNIFFSCCDCWLASPGRGPC